MIDAHRAGGGLASINVESIDHVAAVLRDRGIDLTTVTVSVRAQNVSSIVIGTVIDPDGNKISIVEGT